MAYPVNVRDPAVFLYPIADVELNASFGEHEGVGFILSWDVTAIGAAQPTEQEITDALADATVVNGQTFSQWLVEHGGDQIATLRRLGKEAIDANNDKIIRLLRGLIIELQDLISNKIDANVNTFGARYKNLLTYLDTLPGVTIPANAKIDSLTQLPIFTVQQAIDKVKAHLDEEN